MVRVMNATTLNINSFNAMAAIQEKLISGSTALSTSPRLNALRGTLRTAFESSALKGAVITGGLKFAGKSAADVAGLSTIFALASGGAMTGYEVYKDYNAAIEDGSSSRDALLTLAKNNKLKYTKKFTKETAGFLLGSLAVGANEAIELMEATEIGANIVEKTKDAASIVKEQTSSFFGSLKETVTNVFTRIKSGFKNALDIAGDIAGKVIPAAGAAELPQAEPVQLAYAEPINTSPSDFFTSENKPEIIAETPALELSTNDKLSALTGLTQRAQDIAEAALGGSPQALDDAGVGLLHGAYGFPKDPALAIEMLEKAVEAGSAKAETDLAWALEHNPDLATENIAQVTETKVVAPISEEKPASIINETPQTTASLLTNMNTDGWSDQAKTAYEAMQTQAWAANDMGYYLLNETRGGVTANLDAAKQAFTKALELAEASGNDTIATMARQNLVDIGANISENIAEDITPPAINTATTFPDADIACDVSEDRSKLDCSSFTTNIEAGDTIILNDPSYNNGQGLSAKFTNMVSGNSAELLRDNYIPKFHNFIVAQREYEEEQILAELF